MFTIQNKRGCYRWNVDARPDRPNRTSPFTTGGSLFCGAESARARVSGCVCKQGGRTNLYVQSYCMIHSLSVGALTGHGAALSLGFLDPNYIHLAGLALPGTSAKTWTHGSAMHGRQRVAACIIYWQWSEWTAWTAWPAGLVAYDEA